MPLCLHRILLRPSSEFADGDLAAGVQEPFLLLACRGRHGGRGTWRPRAAGPGKACWPLPASGGMKRLSHRSLPSPSESTEMYLEGLSGRKNQTNPLEKLSRRVNAVTRLQDPAEIP